MASILDGLELDYGSLKTKAKPTDYLKQVGASAVEGVGHLFQGFAEPLAAGVNAIAGTQLRAENPLSPLSEGIRSTISAGGQRAMRDTFEGELHRPETWRAPSTASGWGMTLAQGLGSAGVTAAPVLSVLNRGRKVMTAVGAISGAAQAGGAAAGEARESFEDEYGRLSDLELQQALPAYADLRREGVSEVDARAKVVNRAALASTAGAGALGTLSGAAGGALLGRFVSGQGLPAVMGGTLNNRAGRAGVAAITGGLGEGVQEVAENMGGIGARNLAYGLPVGQGITDNSFGNFAAGALTGGVVSGGMGVAGKRHVQPLPSDANPAPAPVEAPPADAGSLSRAANLLPSPEPVLALPAPESAVYVDSSGQAQQIGPVRNVDGVMRPEPQGRPPVSAGAYRGNALEQQAPVGRQPNEVPAEQVRREDRILADQRSVERANLVAMARVDEANRAAAEIIDARRQANLEPPAHRMPSGLELADKNGHGRWLAERYRLGVEGLVNELVQGGDVAYVRDANGVIVGRTPSINPDWWKNWDDKHKPKSVEEAKRIVKKALEGDNLGPKQARFISIMMDMVDELSVDPVRAEQNRAILSELDWAARGEAARNQADYMQGDGRVHEVEQQDDAELYAYLEGKVEPFRIEDLSPDDIESIKRELIALDDTAEQTRQAGDFNDGEPNGDFQGTVQTRGQVPAQQGLQSAGRRNQEGGASVPVGQRQPDGQQGGFSLETQSEEELAAQAEARQQQEQAEAEQARQEQQRARADRERDGFSLTGSDRTADVAAAAGQGDLLVTTRGERKQEQAESKPNQESAEANPDEFVPAPDGSLDYGEITPEMAKAAGRQAGKIRLQQGTHRENGTGYGLAHIEANHGKQIRRAGFESVESFVAQVARNFSQIRKAGAGQLLVAVKGERENVLFVQLQPASNGDYYRINTAFPASRDYLAKQEKKGGDLLWGGSEPTPTAAGKQPLYAGSPENDPGQAAPIAQGQSNRTIAQEPETTQPADTVEPAGEWQTLVGGTRYRLNQDGVTIEHHDRVVHVRGATSIDASAKAKELALQDIRELHNIGVKSDPSDPFSEATIWLNGRGQMLMKKGAKKPRGAVARVLKVAEKPGKSAAGTAQPAVKIEDAGEKLGGARKDTAQARGKRASTVKADDQRLPKGQERQTINQALDGKTRETESGVELFSRSEPAFMSGQKGGAGRPLSRNEVQAIVDAFLKKYKGANDVRVEIHDTAETLPSYRAERDAGANIQGEYRSQTDTVHLVVGGFRSLGGKSQIEAALREEILVHKGLGVLSPVARQQLYAQIRKAASENAAVKRLWDQTVADYQPVAESVGLTKEQADRYYAEELLGTLAQRKINWATKGWNRLLRALKNLAASIGLIKHTDGPAELVRAVEYIADAFAKGRRARRRNLSQDVRGSLDEAPPSFARTAGTRAAYERRIDDLYAGAKPNIRGALMLDRADVLDMLGISDGPVHVAEGKILQGTVNHRLTAEHWKRVPDWLENPVAVFDSETVPGRLVFFGPELVAGKPVRMIVEPRSDGGGVNLLVNAYEADRNPVHRWVEDGLLRYVDERKTPDIERSGLRLPRLSNIRGYKRKIYSGRDLFKYRASRTGGANDGDVPAFSRTSGQEQGFAAQAMDVWNRVVDRIDGWRDAGARTPESWTPEQKAAAGKFDTFAPKQPVRSALRKISDRSFERATQMIFDQFRPLKKLSEEGFMQAHLSKATDGALEALATRGVPVLRDGAIAIEDRTNGFLGELSKLGSNEEVHKFLMWVAGNRAGKLMVEGRENLFTADDIAAMKSFAKGRMADDRPRMLAYQQALKSLNAYNKAVLDIAEAAGLISGDSRTTWESEFYIPFYRVLDDGSSAYGHGQTGLVRQSVVRKLKGGTESLGDPLENLMSNWHSLLTASMRNMAANKSLDQAVKANIAARVDDGGKNTTWTMRNGQKVHWQVDDPMVLDALESLNFSGYNNPAMRAAGAFKRALTIGVTISPTFRVRNLIRDTLQAVATADVDYNPIKNAIEGWNLTGSDSDTMTQLMAGGGAVRFGSFNDGQQAEYARRMISMGVKENQILDTPAKLKNAIRRFYDSYQEYGDRAETINRAVIYRRVLEQTGSHLDASFAARDLMNFTSMGSSAAIRALAQVLPFFNARLQGMDRLVRGAAMDPRRFWSVAGAVAMASALLYMLQGDDEEYKALPDYVRDTYWPVKLGGTWLYIPKPFEVGSLGTVVERFTELMLSDGDYKSKDFIDSMVGVLTNTLAMNPVPQIVRPVGEAWFNYDMFRQQPIDSMAMQRLLPEDRYTANTSAAAVAAGRTLGVSPQKIEHLMRGYFGWLGIQALNVGDLLGRTVVDMPESPRHDWGQVNNLFVVGDFFKQAGTTPSKYSERFYAVQRDINAIYASANNARREGDMGRYRELMSRPEMSARQMVATANRQITQVNQQMRRITADPSMDASEKSRRLQELRQRRDVIARRVDEAARR